MNRKKMLLIFNPKSGREEFRMNLYEVVDKFTSNGFEVTVYPTREKGDGYQYVLERADDFDYLVCSGGDGTMNETLDALMLCKKKPVFGYIPSGTTNDFATTLGIPKDILQAADIMVNGKISRVDIGKLNKDYFAYVAAFGLFTDVAYATPQDMKNVLGYAAYMLEGVKRFASVKAYACTVVIGNEEIEGEFIFGMVSNARSIGGFQIPSEQSAQLDDGLFEVLLVRKPKRLTDLHDIAKRLLDYSHSDSDAILMRRASRITVRSTEELHWTLDGEYGGATVCAQIEVSPRALAIMVPDGSL